jgi:hypothetical protein
MQQISSIRNTLSNQKSSDTSMQSETSSDSSMDSDQYVEHSPIINTSISESTYNFAPFPMKVEDSDIKKQDSCDTVKNSFDNLSRSYTLTTTSHMTKSLSQFASLASLPSYTPSLHPSSPPDNRINSLQDTQQENKMPQHYFLNLDGPRDILPSYQPSQSLPSSHDTFPPQTDSDTQYCFFNDSLCTPHIYC